MIMNDAYHPAVRPLPIKEKHMRSILTAFVSILLLSIFSSCSPQPAAELSPPGLQQARLVSHASGGVISCGESIRIRFTEALVQPEHTGTPIKEKVIEIDPRVKGSLSWEDAQTIVFTPEQDLPDGTVFTARLNVKALLQHLRSLGMPDPLDNGSELPESFSTRFQTTAFSVSSVSGDFYTIDGNDPSKVYYQVQIDFSEDIERERLREAAELRIDAQKLDFDLLQNGSARSYTFKSEVFVRNESERTLTMNISRRGSRLKDDFTFRTSLAAVDTFTVSDVHPAGTGEPGILVNFSDEISYVQDLTGLIRIEPHIPVQAKRMGKTVYLSGKFEAGEQYRVLVSKGIESKWGSKTVTETANDVRMEDIKPQLEFSQSGVFLPSAGDRRIYFKTVNLRKVNIEVKRVFENNLGQFLQTEQLNSNEDRNRSFNTTYVNRVGVTVAEEELEIGEKENQWLVHELDLRNLIDEEDKGLYLLSLYFEREDMIYDMADDDGGRYYGDDYYNDPRSYGYLYSHGRIYKPLAVSDIGLTWKAGIDGHTVFATDIISARPLRGVKIGLKTYQNQTIAEGYTDAEGKISFNGISKAVFYLSGEKNGMRSVIKANEMSWNTSSFDTGGSEAAEEGTRAFTYTDRGVYRPGDTIHLNAIFRNKGGSFPSRHPITLKFINPLGQTYLDQVYSDAHDGFYHFPIQTEEEDPTGTWRAELYAGSSRFVHNISVETIVPNRLKVRILPEKEIILPQDRYLGIDLRSSYLFGAPAAGLEAEVSARMFSREKTFSTYPGYTFSHEGMEYAAIERHVFSGTLDENGEREIRWEIPPNEGAPSALNILLQARVSEKGGRATRQAAVVPVEPYGHYVGLSRPDMKYGYAQIGSRLRIPYVLLDREGNAVSGRELTYRLYKNTRYWWWEYDSYNDFKVRYKTDVNTELLEEKTLTSGAVPKSISVEPDSWGEYLIEVEDPSGHKAGFFFRASSWSQQSGGPDEGILSITTNKNEYRPGDTAIVTVLTPPEGSILLNVEKGGRILSSEWMQCETTETKLRVPVTADMVPTAYVSVSLLQTYSQTGNDRPIRMYGIVPLNVVKEETRQEVEIHMPDEIKPKEDFSVQIKIKDKKQSQVTVAVVDEGLLDLTGFPSPDPWQSFYSKQRLVTQTFDIFSHVIGAFRGDIFRVFAIGGGEDEMKRMYATGDEEEDSRSRRFEPVALFAGPLSTDPDGTVTVRFTMPNYMGSVRVMVVSAAGASYGHAEKTVPVRSKLVVLPTLPRVLGPEESIRVPVSLFALADIPGSIKVGIETGGPVRIEGTREHQLSMTKNGEEEVFFTLNSEAAIGSADITVYVNWIFGREEYSTVLPLRPSSPPLSRTFSEPVQAGGKTSLTLPGDGIPGSNRAIVSVSRRQNLNIDHRLRWLMRYPYGCIEQTVSAVFPQLYLKKFISSEDAPADGIDTNINAAIERLRKFQLPSGGFSYWPGNDQLSVWGTNYAGHFLIEAMELGYHVPQEMLSHWLRFQSGRALSSRDTLTERVYRLYLLAAAGSPAVGPMNLLNENSLHEMWDVEKWLLAVSYYLSGMQSRAFQIIADAGTEVGDYEELGGTYGSSLRDLSMILDAAVVMDRDETADRIADDISLLLSTDTWYSTQTTGYSLLALGKYLSSLEAPGTRIAGSIFLPDGTLIPFSTDETIYQIDITDKVYPSADSTAASTREDSSISIAIDPDSSAKRVFTALTWEGIPLKAEKEAVQKHLELSVFWYDDNGNAIDPSQLEQGQEFWAHLSVSREDLYQVDLEEMALTQIFPAGWEIINTRLNSEANPWWMNDLNLYHSEYTDIRDDRVSWFFDMPAYDDYYDFAIKLQAVTVGTFSLPPASVQAMYRNDFKAVHPGGTVRVTARR
jgi:hypothetical protein